MERRDFLKAAAAAGSVLCLQGCSSRPSEPSAPPSLPAAELPTIPATPAADHGGEPGYTTEVPCEQGHELVLAAIAANGVDKIFFCGGSDNYHFMESVAKFKALGRPSPDLVTVAHESCGVYMNMGYFQWTRRPQVTMLHVSCGTMNAGAAYEEAWHANAGVVVMAGRTGWTTKGELPGGRGTGVHWQQEVYNQADLVRAYCKWNYEIKTPENAGLLVQRAFRVAASEPCGMAYLTLPPEVLVSRLQSGLTYQPADFPPAVSPQGDLAALQEAARLLVQAENPVVLVKGMGRNPEAVPALVALAEKLALPVAADETYMNFPKNHWARSGKGLKDRDVILIIDHDVPWLSKDPPDQATIISLDPDPMRLKQPLWGFPVHVPVTCDSSKAIPLINQLADQFLTSQRKEAIALRRAAMEGAAQKPHRGAHGAGFIRRAVNEISDEDTVLLWDRDSLEQGDRTPPGHVFGRWGSSLGGVWPRAVGIKLAAPGKTVIASGGDGGTLFCHPEVCLMASRMYEAPVLYIVSNNREYGAVRRDLDSYGGDDSYAARTGYNGSRLEPPDFAKIAEASGAYGESVNQPAQLPEALQRALKALKEGKSAVLDVFIT